MRNEEDYTGTIKLMGERIPLEKAIGESYLYDDGSEEDLAVVKFLEFSKNKQAIKVAINEDELWYAIGDVVDWDLIDEIAGKSG